MKKTSIIVVSIATLVALAYGVVSIGRESEPYQATGEKTSDGAPTDDSTASSKQLSKNNQQAGSSFRASHQQSPGLAASSKPSVGKKTVASMATDSPAIEQRQDTSVVSAEGETYPLRIYKTQGIPDDPLPGQWWQNSIGLPAALDIGPGETPTTLAIIDTGFALDHEEFTDRWHENDGEIGSTAAQNPSILNCTDRGLALNKSCNNIDDDFDGILNNEIGSATRENPSILNCADRGLALNKSCNNIDDDDNGMADDVTGWDFVSYYPSPQAGKTNSSGAATAHGTQVAGIATATSNNGRGIAGVDSHTKILPIQAISDDDYGDTITVSRAIRYAADQGADVISMSLGTSSPDAYLRQSMAYAIEKGSIIVAASGNDGCDCMLYPAKYEEAIAVGATNQSNQRSSFSSWGANLDIVAPGQSMVSTTWQASNQTSSYASGISGTSFATPLVAGLLTSLKSHQPDANAHQIVGALTEHTNRIGIPSTVMRTNTVGFGLIDTQAAMTRASSLLSPPLRYAFGPASAGTSVGSYEPVGKFDVYQCGQDQLGTTSLYKLSKGTNFVYSISPVEKYKATELGYLNQLIVSGFCISLPTDTPGVLRTISIQSELENRPTAKSQ